jgi:hypothetical protein
MLSCPVKLFDTKARNFSPLVIPSCEVEEPLPPPHDISQHALRTIRKIPIKVRFNLGTPLAS